MHYTSEDGKYQVDVAIDGAIKVGHGDWLSKYSAAIHGNYWNIHAFARKDRNGNLVPVGNPNLIHMGETIYHLPTYEVFIKNKPRVQTVNFTQPMVIVGKRRAGPPVQELSFDEPMEIVGRRIGPMSEKEKKKFILEHLRGEYELRGEHFEFVNELADHLHEAGEAVEILEIVAEYLPAGLAEALPHALVTVLEGVSEYCPIIGALAFPVHATIEWVNALEFGQRLIGLRAVAYGITAWVFDEAVPTPPPWIRANISPGSLQGPHHGHNSWEQEAIDHEERDVQASLSAWRKSSEAAYRNMGEEVEKKGGDKEELKSVLRLLADDDQNTLVRRLMAVIAEKYLRAGFERDAFWSPDPNYPN